MCVFHCNLLFLCRLAVSSNGDVIVQLLIAFNISRAPPIYGDLVFAVRYYARLIDASAYAICVP